MVYFEGTQAYLVPYALRTFFNSLESQRKLLGYEPETDITVMLADFEDYGNAGVSVLPRSFMMVQISPLSFAFETIAANERMNTIMNHELVHVATLDQTAARDRIFRNLFAGKVNAIAEQPETILYQYLTAPRTAAPRWFHEGIAVFIDTWMAGGMGRAQSGYDEMVFRSMVRDNAHFYDPLGLVSEGTKVDFQLQINSYLYGTRFMMWLANTYGPAKLLDWVKRQEGSRAYYATHFKHIFGRSLERRLAGVDRVGARIPAEEPGRDSPASDDAATRTCRGGRSGRSRRRTTTKRPASCTPPSTTQGSSRTSDRSTSPPAISNGSSTSRGR